MFPLGTWFFSGICVRIPRIKETMMMMMIMIIIIIIIIIIMGGNLNYYENNRNKNRKQNSWIDTYSYHMHNKV